MQQKKQQSIIGAEGGEGEAADIWGEDVPDR